MWGGFWPRQAGASGRGQFARDGWPTPICLRPRVSAACSPQLGTALCERQDKKFEACGRCPACLQVAAGSHPDFVVSGRPEESNEVPIETIRDLCQGFGLKSARGRGRIAILDDADDLNDASANCFLKTLEEPPPRSLLLLIGTSADRQLPTIRSRCQVVTFAPLKNEDLRAVLQANAFRTQPLDRLLRFGEGSPELLAGRR